MLVSIQKDYPILKLLPKYPQIRINDYPPVVVSANFSHAA